MKSKTKILAALVIILSLGLAIAAPSESVEHLVYR